MGQAAVRKDPSRLTALLGRAVAWQRQGMLREAERGFRSVVALAPGHAEANFHLGVLLAGRGSPRDALPFFRVALRANPGQGRYWLGYIDALLGAGSVDTASQALDQGKARGLSGRAVEALTARIEAASRPGRKLATPRQRERFLVLCNADRRAAALRFGRRLAERAPDDAFVWKTLGVLLGRDARFEEAVRVHERALTLAPRDPELRLALGTMHKALGRPDEALACYGQALALRPDFVEAHYNLANALLELDRPDEARAHYEQALALRPDFADARNNLGVALETLGRLEEALACYGRTLALAPDHSGAYNNRGNTLLKLGRQDEALESYRQAVALRPDYPEAQKNMGTALTELGYLAEAEACLARALALRPDYAEAIYSLGFLGRIQAGDPFAARLQAMLAAPATSEKERLYARFALGKIHDEAGEYAQAMAQYAAGHDCRSRVLGLRYDNRRTRARLETYRAVITPSFFQTRRDWGHSSPSPIFVVGFPRSGTSLVEQILASHSAVFGAGERWDLERLAVSVTPFAEAAQAREAVEGLTREAARDLAESYLRSLSTVSGAAPRVVDKMPHNFQHLWLAALLFPKARILHCCRTPEATCLSCYFQNFTEGHAFADDLFELGRHYRFYLELMDHWRQVVPIPVHEVVYGRLVSDPEAEIRRLLAVCDLPFEAGCLAFHETSRPVKTASAVQVRRKMYRSSLEKWRHYEPFLEPLRRGLSGQGGSA